MPDWSENPWHRSYGHGRVGWGSSRTPTIAVCGVTLAREMPIQKRGKRHLMGPTLGKSWTSEGFSYLPQKFHELRIEELHYLSA
jgi:hypothetical protein